MRFFLDNNLAPKLARGLNEFVRGEHEVVHLRERYDASTPDVEWMKKLSAEPGWVIISADVRIGRNPHEIEAWKQAGHVIFFLKAGWTNVSFWDQVVKLSKCFPDIIEEARRAQPGESFTITVRGEIER